MKSKSASLQIRRLFEGMRFLVENKTFVDKSKRGGSLFHVPIKKLQGQILQLFHGFIVLAV